MPTYVYKFTDTGETIEVQQAFTDPTLTELAHPSDGTMRAVKKVFQPVGITFKGRQYVGEHRLCGVVEHTDSPRWRAQLLDERHDRFLSTRPAPLVRWVHAGATSVATSSATLTVP